MLIERVGEALAKLVNPIASSRDSEKTEVGQRPTTPDDFKKPEKKQDKNPDSQESEQKAQPDLNQLQSGPPANIKKKPDEEKVEAKPDSNSDSEEDDLEEDRNESSDESERPGLRVEANQIKKPSRQSGSPEDGKSVATVLLDMVRGLRSSRGKTGHNLAMSSYDRSQKNQKKSGKLKKGAMLDFDAS